MASLPTNNNQAQHAGVAMELMAKLCQLREMTRLLPGCRAVEDDGS